MADEIPTRMSVYDHRFDRYLAKRMVITVNDIVQPDVLAYDIDEGVVTRFVTDDNGKFVIHHDTDEPATEQVRGEVVVVLQPI